MTVVDFIGLVDQAIYNRLLASPGTAFYGSHVYRDQAPEGTPLPFVVFTHIAGGEDNLTPNESEDVVYSVLAVGDTSLQASTGNGYIEQAFPRNTTLTVTNYANYGFLREQFIRRVDNIGGTQFYRRGSNYRLLFDRTGG